MDRDLFQGRCLQSGNGKDHMDDFDAMPPRVRTRLQSSVFNLCAACVREISGRSPTWKGVKAHGPIEAGLWAIEQMEAQIRAEEITPRSE